MAAVLACVFFMGAGTAATPTTLGASGAADSVTITIEKPKGWRTKETAVAIAVKTDFVIDKVEAKTSGNGSFVDITEDMAVTISENCTVTVQVTDETGAVYTKSRYLEVFDREAPTVKAKLEKNLLHVEVNDDLSGVSAVYVDGEKYTGLTNDTLDIRVKDLGKDYPEIEIQAVDDAGNRSKVVTVKNPNYTDESEDKSLNGSASTTTAPQSGTGTTQDISQQSGGATATNTIPPASASAPVTAAPASASTGSASPAAANTNTNSGGSGGGDSSEAPLFGTYEDAKKQFMTIVTKDGAVYYLIIDHDKESENVYFLSEVTNSELASFTPPGEDSAETEEYPEYIGEKPEEAEEIGFVDENPAPAETETAADAPPDGPEPEAPPEETKKSGGGAAIFIIIAILGVGGAGFYFKVYKPKKELAGADDLDDFEFAEGEELFGEDSEE